MPVGVVVLVVALVAATAFAVYRKKTDGHLSTVSGVPVDGGPIAVPTVSHHKKDVLLASDLGSDLGEKATLVQFSSAFCQPCKVTRVVLGQVADMVPGVRHVEIDAEHHLDLVRELDIRRTPTTFVLDSAGHIVRRASGVPRKPEVIAAIGELV